MIAVLILIFYSINCYIDRRDVAIQKVKDQKIFTDQERLWQLSLVLVILCQNLVTFTQNLLLKLVWSSLD